MPSILENKDYQSPSVFLPQNLLREARRQMNKQDCAVPRICIFDPDGDLVDYLLDQDRAKKNECWACYHSHLYSFEIDGIELGILPCVVGASYAVLVAEQLFVSGCQFLISITSAGIVRETAAGKDFALITEARRDEGTSYHYLPENSPARLAPDIREQLASNDLWFEAKSWTTDAPYRETTSALEAMKAKGITCVEMEAAALYAFAEARGRSVACFAHLTNTMAQEEGDFEKGEDFGSLNALALIEGVLRELEKQSDH